MNNFLGGRLILCLVFGFIGFFGFLVVGRFNYVIAQIGTYDVYTDLCHKNNGTNWAVQYKVLKADFSWTAYQKVWTTPGGDATACERNFGSTVGGVLAQQRLDNMNPDNARIFWWTQCHDPEEKPNITGQTFINFAADVTFPGGNNLGNVDATDWTGSSCPIRQPGPGPGPGGGQPSPPPPEPPPAPINLQAFPGCDENNVAKVDLSWSAVERATDYTTWRWNGFDFIQIEATGGSTTATFFNLADNTTYSWGIKAHNSAGASELVRGPDFTTPVCQGPIRLIHTLTVNLAGSGAGTVTSNDGRISCRPTCSAIYNQGTPVTLTATADANSDFGRWDFCDSVSGTSCAVTMNTDRTVTATFNLRPLGVGSCTVSPTSAVAGVSTSFTFTVADSWPGPGGQAGYLFAWGDGSSIAQSRDWAQNSTFAIAHTYASDGSYSNSVSITGPGSAPFRTIDCGTVGVAVVSKPGPINLRVEKPNCSDGPYQSQVTFRWDNASDGSWYLDIATWDMKVNDSPQANRQLSAGATSSPVPGGHTLNPDTNYYWRIWPGRDLPVPPNQYRHAYPAVYPFNVPKCTKGTLNLNGIPGCTNTPAKPYVDLSWSDSAAAGQSHYYVFWRSQAGGGTIFVFQGASPPNPVRDNNVSTNTAYTYQLQDQRDGRVSPVINVRTLVCVADKPDLTVTIESLTPANPLKPNDPVTVGGKVTNIGTTASQGFFVWFFNDQAAEPGCPPVDRDGDFLVSSLAAGASRDLTYNYNFNAPAPPGAKTFWAFADGGCNIEESNEANNTASRVYTVGAVVQPPPPGVMDVTLTANGQKVAAVPAGSTVTLAWVTSVSPRPQACVGFAAPSDDNWAGSKDRLGGTKQLIVSVNTTFSITCVLGSNSKTDSAQVIVTAAPPAGLGSCTIVPTSASAGTATTFTWTVTDSLNSGSGDATYSFNWGDFGTSDTRVQAWQKVSTFTLSHTYTAGGVHSVSVSIIGPVGAVPVTRGPFICSPPVGVTSGGGGWFETVAGDVGSSGAISLKAAPPVGKYQSTYLLAGDDLTNVKTAPGGWSIEGYKGPLVPVGGVYNYLSARFKQEAVKNGHATCTISAGSLPQGKKFGYCAADAEFNVGNGPNGDQVWFIDGNLTIKKDLKLAARDTVTFIVRGNITFNADVERADGIYVAGGTLATSDTGAAGKQLVVNGAVLAQTLSLNRILANANCGVSPCDNSVNPAERVLYDPKYLVGLNSVLGSPSVAWREVAP